MRRGQQGDRMQLLILIALTWLAASGPAAAQSWRPPTDAERCPSPWGAADERGAGNLKSPELVLRAARLIRTGEVIELGQVLSADMPLSPTRQFDLHTKRTIMNTTVEPEGFERGAGPQRDWPGRDAVRRLRPSDHRRQLVQLFQD